MDSKDLDQVSESLHRMYMLGYSEGKAGKKPMEKEVMRERMKIMSKFVK